MGNKATSESGSATPPAGPDRAERSSGSAPRGSLYSRGSRLSIMGALGSSHSLASDAAASTGKPAHFEKWELGLLEKLFDDLSKRSPGSSIDKSTFLQFFRLPGMIGERLFKFFDKKNLGSIDFEEFVEGLKIYSRGSVEDKLHMLFDMLDFSDDHLVSKENLSLMLHSLLTPVNVVIDDKFIDDKISTEKMNKKLEETIDSTVTEAFSASKTGELTYEQFRTWILGNAEILQKFESITIENSWESVIPMTKERGLRRATTSGMDLKIFCHKCGFKALHCYRCGVPLRSSTFKCESCGILLNFPAEFDYCITCGSSLTKTFADHKLDLVEEDETKGSSTTRPLILKEGIVHTKSSILRSWKTRYLVLSDNYLYVYKSQSEARPSKIIFIEGCLIEPIAEESGTEHFGFEIVKTGVKTTKEGFYVDSEETRTEWISELRKAANTVPITEKYRFGKKIGTGRFSNVFEGFQIKTGTEYAIKVIDKTNIDDAEREELRSEIAVLSLLHHPNIIQLKEVFETPEKLYIVMQLCRHGDLFSRLKSMKSGISESDAKKIIWQLVRVIVYLHSYGIVHRDLKPENILMMDDKDVTNIALSDFGLSKFVAPKELMNVACGTVFYIAPEVLKMTGYNQNVDYWSIGVIMYLLLGKQLPFQEPTQTETMRSILTSTVKFPPSKWSGISEDARSLLSGLLEKDPTKRVSGEDILEHKWFDSIREEMNALQVSSPKPLPGKHMHPLLSSSLMSSPLSGAETPDITPRNSASLGGLGLEPPSLPLTPSPDHMREIPEESPDPRASSHLTTPKIE